MKSTQTLILTLAASGLFAFSHASAQTPPPAGPASEAFLERFDTNGDGFIDQAEKEAAREALRRQRAQNRGSRVDGAPRSQRPQVDWQALKEEFDANGDGQLDADEREAARQAMAQRMILERFDANGNGTLEPEEKAAAQAAREERIAQFDTNGDGRLDESERAAAKQAFLEQHPKAREVHQRRLERFDTDGDGQLDESEREAARQAAGEHIAQFDTDGDGQLSPEERQAARQYHLVQKFDANGDGQLDEAERATAFEHMQKVRQERPRAGKADGPRGPRFR